MVCQEQEQETETDMCSCAGLFTTTFADRSTCCLFSDLNSVVCEEQEQETETDTYSCAGLLTTTFADRSTCRSRIRRRTHALASHATPATSQTAHARKSGRMEHTYT